MIRIGIDPSMQSTGVCVYNVDEDTNIYYIVPSKMTKKMTEFHHPFVTLLPYQKDSTTDMEYSEKEYTKTWNFVRLCEQIVHIISDVVTRWPNNHEIEFIMEGISYGSAGGGQVADLAGLNYMIRTLFVQQKDNFIIVPPTKLKSFAVGNGAADKSVMVASWKKLDKNICGISDIKIDDLADAYFLAHYEN